MYKFMVEKGRYSRRLTRYRDGTGPGPTDGHDRRRVVKEEKRVKVHGKRSE